MLRINIICGSYCSHTGKVIGSLWLQNKESTASPFLKNLSNITSISQILKSSSSTCLSTFSPKITDIAMPTNETNPTRTTSFIDMPNPYIARENENPAPARYLNDNLYFAALIYPKIETIHAIAGHNNACNLPGLASLYFPDKAVITISAEANANPHSAQR